MEEALKHVYFSLDFIPITLIPSKSEENELISILRNDHHNENAARKLHKILRIKKLAEIAQNIVRKNSFTKEDFLEIFEHFGKFGKESEEMSRKPMWNIFVNFFTKMNRTASSSSSSSLNEASDYSKSFDILFDHLGDEMNFKI